MGTFAMPALPSLPSVKSLINVSPPLVYPSPETKKHSRSRAASISGSTAQVIQEHHAASPSWNDRGRGRAIKRYGEGDDTPTRRPHIPHPTSLLASPKHDPIDARQWEPLPSRPVMDWRDDTTPHASPSRPPLGSHRRSHSAVPHRQSFPTAQPSAPMGRLHEFTRNALASTSAISLPTLLEAGDGSTEEGSSLLTEESGESTLSPGLTPVSISSPRCSLSSLASSTSPSPAIQARSRKGSRSTAEGTQASSPISPVSLPSLMPPPLIPDSSTPRGEHRRSFSSVPPPQAMRPPPLPMLVRGQRSRRGSESQAAPLSPSRSPFSHRHSSSTSTASVSDVAVLAKWSFPNSPEKPARPTLDVATPPAVSGQPSDRLRQRLRSLSTLDTSSAGPTPEASPSTRPRTSTEPRASIVEPIVGAVLTPARVAKPGLARASTTVRQEPHRFTPHLTHRHSQSSPSDIVPSLPIGPSISGSYHPTCGSGLNPASQAGQSPLRPPLVHPPARHARKPTTSRLRQPNPLCMPIAIPHQVVRNHSSQTISSLGHVQITPASSPGSMISDLLSIVSSENGVSELDKMSSEDADGVSVQSLSTDELGLGSSDNGHGGESTQGLMVEVEDKPKARGLGGFRLRSMASTPSLKPIQSAQVHTLRSNKSTLSLRTLGLGIKDGPKTDNPGRWSFFGGLVGLAKRKNSVADLSTRTENDRRSRAQSMVDSYKAHGDAGTRRRGLSMSLHGSSYGFTSGLEITTHDVDEDDEDEQYIDGDHIF